MVVLDPMAELPDPMAELPDPGTLMAPSMNAACKESRRRSVGGRVSMAPPATPPARPLPPFSLSEAPVVRAMPDLVDSILSKVQKLTSSPFLPASQFVIYRISLRSRRRHIAGASTPTSSSARSLRYTFKPACHSSMLKLPTKFQCDINAFLGSGYCKEEEGVKGPVSWFVS